MIDQQTAIHSLDCKFRQVNEACARWQQWYQGGDSYLLGHLGNSGRAAPEGLQRLAAAAGPVMWKLTAELNDVCKLLTSAAPSAEAFEAALVEFGSKYPVAKAEPAKATKPKAASAKRKAKK